MMDRMAPTRRAREIRWKHDDPNFRSPQLLLPESVCEGLLITVGDSGPGIAPEDRERVFESFYTTESGGVGIGLSIRRSIIDAHGGQLWTDAHHPRGAVFTLTLPALS
jgi:signal transduction histidine kinase